MTSESGGGGGGGVGGALTKPMQKHGAGVELWKEMKRRVHTPLCCTWFKVLHTYVE